MTFQRKPPVPSHFNFSIKFLIFGREWDMSIPKYDSISMPMFDDDPEQNDQDDHSIIYTASFFFLVMNGE